MLSIHHQPDSNLLLTTITGELDETDYNRLLPEVQDNGSEMANHLLVNHPDLPERRALGRAAQLAEQ